MPRTPDHLVECHRIRRERVNRGLKAWAHTVQLGHVFHDDDLSFIQRRDAIVAVLKGSTWVNGNGDITDCIDGLEQSLDEEEFDQWWDELYDHADMDSVWIDTTTAERL